MNLLVKNVTVADPQSKFNNQQCDIRVENGKIKNIGKLIADKSETIFDAQGAFLTPGFFDLNCAAGDPGFETKEDIQTLTATAKAGGFTGLALLPQTNPVVQSKSQVEYIINKAKNNLVDVLPVGAISQNREAKELAELFDMQQAGAVAFSDGDKALQDDGFMSRALQYAKGFNALLMVHPENKSIAGKSQINESKNSVLLGMKGLPALAEEMHIARDIFLASYNETKIHISNISTAGAVALIRKAKKDGVQVSCDVTAHHLVFTEELLSDFDSNYKVKPPLRGKADVKALIVGLKDGTIDAITSQHRPEEIEFKNVEFEIAHYGIIALQTVVPLLIKAGLDIGLITEKLAVNPRKLLNLLVPVIEEGAEANFTILNTSEKWLYNAASNYSRSANSPLLGAELTGKVKLVYNNNQYWEG
ncbi:dihydroorotase [Pedobacter sp. AK013]|uniref:dihydroorotase n=1 Tax=Pedobacter sp. AK013 TaxID=2723071 RepID=UPI001613F85C|nr:dihydroorotase [Pedobacter sp. AK013]MBB6240053.1 dihydroorotase [Pedobacter sp. AK013]